MDIKYALITIAAFLYGLLIVFSRSINPIKQAKALIAAPGIAKGIVIVAVVTLGVVLLTNKAEAYSLDVGLDYTLGRDSDQCVDDPLASNIYLRAYWGWIGPQYNHQSCAISEDADTWDGFGIFLYRHVGPVELIAEGQLEKDGRELYAFTGAWVVYQLDQYSFLVFLQKQAGAYDETSAGVNMRWSF